jgi:hypothetical protein
VLRSRYGALVQRLAKTNKTAALASDRVVNKLGYWTDSGAFYYGDIPFKHNLSAMAATLRPGATMEQVAVAVKSKLDEQQVPIQYWQWDDWWYPGHPVYVYCVRPLQQNHHDQNPGLTEIYKCLVKRILRF